jgi:outer membrane protein OmpA-like peptidoglycan-associated protein
LMVNPQLQVEVAVHSDTRSDAAKELKLSQERADAIVKYLRAKGVAKDHIVGIGQGVKKPMNRCGPGVNCTEEEHAMNRRVEYTVTAILAQ